MNNEQATLLIMLADHIEKQKQRKHKHFDFDIISKCGTYGCAIGEMPQLFPDKCFYRPSASCDREYHVVSKDTSNWVPLRNFSFAEDFFGISDPESSALFNPHSDDERQELELKALPIEPSAKEVANNIRLFVNNKLKNKEVSDD